MIRFHASAAVVLSAFASSAHAQQERVTVSYQAPPECPSGEAFIGNMTARLPKGRTVVLSATPPASPEVLTLSVRITKTSTSYRAELTSFTSEGWSAPRHLEDPTCSELSDAMAFTAALTVDPNASADVSPSAPPASSTPASSAPVPPDTSPPPASSSSEKEPPAVRAPPAATEPRRGSFSMSHEAEWRTSVLVGATLAGVLDPGLAPGVSAGVRYSDEARGPWSPALTLSALAAKSFVPGRSLDASFEMVGGQLDICPSATGTETLTVRPCLNGQVLVLKAAAQNVDNPSDTTVAVPSVGAGIELQWQLSRVVFLSSTLGGQVTMQLHRFDVGRPARPLAETRRISPNVGIRLGFGLD